MATTTELFNSLNSTSAAKTGTTTGTSSSAKNADMAEAGDRFLKLLVTQIQNQDPLNPMDNAQVTSQMAQIQTVSGLEKVNTTVQSLNAQFLQLQALSGAALVGRNVLLEGNTLLADETGVGHAGVELAGSAGSVVVEVLNRSGQVIDSMDLGALSAGRHSFDWIPPAQLDPAQAARFRVTAQLGGEAVAATPLARDTVDAVSTSATGLMLELSSAGPVKYDAVKAFD